MKKIFTICLCALSLSTYAQQNTYKVDETFKIAQNGILKLYSGDANVTIKGEDRLDAHVYIYRNHIVKGIKVGSKSFQVDIEEDKGNLYLTERESGSLSMIGYSNLEYEIVIKIPKTVHVKLRGDDDDYEISNLHGNIEVDADDSDIDITNCSSTSFSFDLDDGDITIDKGSGALYASLDDGDITIENGDFKTVEISTDDGDIDIATKLHEKGAYDFRVDDGGMQLTVLNGGGYFDIDHDDGYIKATEHYNLVKTDEDYKRFSLPGGTAQINIRCNDSRVSLR